jgi:hypothetical protein
MVIPEMSNFNKIFLKREVFLATRKKSDFWGQKLRRLPSAVRERAFFFYGLTRKSDLLSRSLSRI